MSSTYEKKKDEVSKQRDTVLKEINSNCFSMQTALSYSGSAMA